MNKEKMKKAYSLDGFYSLDFRGITAATLPILQAVHSIFYRAEAGDWRDIRSFDKEVEALLPPGFASGGGAHHIWIQEETPGSFKIKIAHDPNLYYKLNPA